MDARLDDDLKLALELCSIADELTLVAFARTDLSVESKADLSPVTEADRAVEVAISQRLNRERPSDLVMGEEFGQTAPSEPSATVETRRWLIDPIDGTANFIRHIPVWATLLSLEIDDEVVLGVVSAPGISRRWWATRGSGAFQLSPLSQLPERMRVSTVSSLSDAYISGTSLNYWDGRGGHAPYSAVATQARWDRGIGDFWSHMLVAEGAVDVALDPMGNIWDFAALKIIVEEAGGRFSDFSANPRPDGGSALSSNGIVHDLALAALTKGFD